LSKGLECRSDRFTSWTSPCIQYETARKYWLLARLTATLSYLSLSTLSYSITSDYCTTRILLCIRL